MASQYKESVSWGHNVAESSEKATRVIDLSKKVAASEHGQDACGMYAVLSPLEGQHFSQPTRLEIIVNHDEGYIDHHRSSDAVQTFNKAVEDENLLSKPESKMSFTTVAGYTFREDSSQAHPGQQFIWIAKLDSHPGKFDEFVEAIKTHATNVQRTEAETLSFLVLQSHDTENSVTLFERYTSEEYFKNVHSNSASMQEYREKMKELMVERVTAGFRLVAGFVDKREALV